MKLERTPKVMPPNPGAGSNSAPLDGDYKVWRHLVPRLVHPLRLEIIEVLLVAGEPLAVHALTQRVALAEGNIDLVLYHAQVMVAQDVLRPVKTPGPSNDTFYELAVPR